MSKLPAFFQAQLMGHTIHFVLALLAIASLYFFRQFLLGWKDLQKLHKEEHFLRDRFLAPLVERVAPKDVIAIRQLRMQLVQAGFRDDNAIGRYTQARIAALAAAAVWTFCLVVSGTEASRLVLLSGLAFVSAMMGPESYLRRRAEARQQRVTRALPMLTDLMVLCLDVGLSVEASFERVTAEMRTMEPLMSDEASLMLSEMSAGLTFAQALRRMAERIGTEDLTTLSRLISQASLLGASVAQALREYAEASLVKRMLTLEERAGQISSMLTLPITACLLPAAMVALIGPSIILLMRALAGAN